MPDRKATNDPRVRALFEAVAREPERDEHRAALADVLMAIGDPRGHFINIQLREAAGRASDSEVGRARQLRNRHWRKWLAPIREFIADINAIGFRRGFLSRWQPTHVPPERWKEILALPI